MANTIEKDPKKSDDLSEHHMDHFGQSKVSNYSSTIMKMFVFACPLICTLSLPF
jgi:hypothetical protein